MIVLMEKYVIYLGLIFFGLCFGSFAGAMMWRLRAYQIRNDKKAGEKFSQDEYDKLNKLTKSSFIKSRSRCLHCSYELKWYDLIPLVSWLSLGGKCRRCRRKIGTLEPIIELGVAAFFVASYAFWPNSLAGGLEATRFIIWLIAGVGLAILFAYDAKWFLLPDTVSYIVIGVGAINSALVVLSANNKTSSLFSVLVATLILSGLYWVLYMLSNGKWIGFGDVKLGLGLALLLADWKLAFLALFSANLIGCLIVIPAMLAGKLKRSSYVPFGPLLIIGFVIAGLFGQYLLNIYFSIMI